MGTAILYKANETQFNHLGLGPLNDAISILVTEERNGIFELEMKYPVSGKVFHELKNDRIIKADAGHKLKDQRFKIIRITKPLKGVVTVYAEHVSYLTQDLALKPKVTFSGNARQALEHWKANLVDDNPFTVWSDISTTGKINWTIDEVENARRALGGVRGSILDVYGGEYLFDNYDIYLYQKRGVNSELLIAYGRNLVDLEQEEEIANTYTSIYPYSIYTDDDGNERMVTLPEYYIDSEHVDKYARRKILVVDFTADEIKTVSALRSAARRYIKDNDVGVPKVNLKIQYVDLAKTLDYKDLALYEEVNLCDNVMIYFEKYDINTTAKVIKVVWDVLNERYDSIEVGEARASLSQAIDTVVDGKVHNVEKLAMQTLRTADGKNTIYFGLEEPTGDQLKKNDIWYRIVDGEFTRTYRYDGVTWQLIIDMDSQEAKQEAQQAKDRAEEAVERANQATQQATDAINQAQASFDLAQENALELETLGLRFDDVEGNLTTISGTVDGLQTTVSDVQGNVSNLTQLSNAMQAQLKDVEGNVNTLTLTSQSMQSTISSLQTELDELEIGGRNLLLGTTNEELTGEFRTWNSDVYYVSDNVLDEVKHGGTYTMSVYFTHTESNNNSRFGLIFQFYYSHGAHHSQYYSYNTFLESGETGWSIYTFNLPDVSDIDEIIGARVFIRSDNNATGSSAGKLVRYKWLKLEKGNKATDWTPAPEDMATQSQITQLSDAINLRVAKGDVLSQINLEAGRTLIDTDKLVLSANTTHVTGDFKLDGSAHIKDASIGTAQIGTIDAGIANIININANNITGGVLSSQNNNVTFDLNAGKLYIRDGSIEIEGGLSDNQIKSAGKWNAQGTYIDGNGVYTGTIVASQIRGGVLRSLNATTNFDLNTGRLYMRNAQFVLGGGARMVFQDPSNNLTYDYGGRRGGIGFGNSVGGKAITFVGHTRVSDPFTARDSSDFHGFVSNAATSGRIPVNTVVGQYFRVRNNIGDIDNGFEFNVTSHAAVLMPLDPNKICYLGVQSHPFTQVTANEFVGELRGSSSRELKKNIKPMSLEDSLQFIKNTEIVSFNWKRDKTDLKNRKRVGFIIENLSMDNEHYVKVDDDYKLNNIVFMQQQVIQYLLKKIENIEKN